MKTNKWPYIFVLPYFLLYFAFGLYPILFSFYISFTNWDGIGEKKFVGLANYIYLFDQGSNFLPSIANTVILMLEYTAFLLITGLIVAVLLKSPAVKMKRVFQLVNILPYITTPVAIGLIFALLFDWQSGMVNKVLIQTGLVESGLNWLGTGSLARLIIGIMVFWRYAGYHAVIYLAGMSSISQEVYEAAIVDGSSSVNTFFRITIPLLKPVMLFLLITDIIGGFQLIEEPMLLLTGWVGGSGIVGGPDRSCLTIVWNLFDTAFGTTSRYGLGSAIAYGLFVIILGFSFVSFKLMNRGESME